MKLNFNDGSNATLSDLATKSFQSPGNKIKLSWKYHSSIKAWMAIIPSGKIGITYWIFLEENNKYTFQVSRHFRDPEVESFLACPNELSPELILNKFAKLEQVQDEKYLAQTKKKDKNNSWFKFCA